MRSIKGLLIIIGGLIVIVGVLVAVKGLQIASMVAEKEAFVPPPEKVTVAQVRAMEWESVLTAVGSLQAVQGVIVSAELPGRITKIAFKSGTRVEAGQVLLQQDISVESAEQSAAQSELALARKNYERAKELLPRKVISESAFDESEARYDKALAQLENIRASIAKKTVRAPFAGRLGIRQVNLGEILQADQPIVSLQSRDPIYVNFMLPQQRITQLKEGLRVRVIADGSDGRQIQGIITAINSEVDSATRNIRVQATLSNPGEELQPGMYVNVAVVLPGVMPVLAIPTTAVQFAPYGNSVFVVEAKKEGAAAGGKVVRQQFVQLGEEHGDFIAVRSGLKPGDTVVSTGVFKLRSGQSVELDNTLSPKFQLEPRPEDA